MDPITITSVRGRIIGALRTRLVALQWCKVVLDARLIDEPEAVGADLVSVAGELAAGRSPIEVILTEDTVTRDNAAGPVRYSFAVGLVVLLPAALPPRAAAGAGLEDGSPVLAAELACERLADLLEVIEGGDRTLGGLADDIASSPMGAVGLHPVYGVLASDVVVTITYSAWPGQPRRGRAE